jgi:hypothetical protein
MLPTAIYGANGNISSPFFLKIIKLNIRAMVKPTIKANRPFLNPKKKPIAPANFISPPPTLS